MPIVLARNLIKNPSCDDTSGTVVTRTNLAVNPGLEVDTAAWAASATITATRTTAEFNSGVASLQAVQTGTADPYVQFYNRTNTAVVALRTYTISAYVKAPVGKSVRLRLIYFTAANTVITDNLGPLVAGTGAWVRHTYTLIAPATAAKAEARINGDATLATFYVDDAMFEETDVALGFFYGATAAAGDYTYTWSGTAHASTSQQRAPALVNLTSAGSVGSRSTERSLYGAGSLRVLWNSVAAGAGNTLQTVTGLVVGQSYTLRVSVWVPTGSPALRPFIVGEVNGTQVTLKDQWVMTETTFTATATSHQAGLYVDAAAVKGDDMVWVDGAMLVEGSTLPGWFSGDTTDGTPTADIYYAWEGAANASTSIKYVRLRATPEPTSLPPRTLLELDLSDLTPDPTEATVMRRDADGRTRPVRLAAPAALLVGLWQGYDYESPFGQAATYEVTAGVDSAVSAPVTLQVDDVAWLRHPGIPSLSVPVALDRFRKDSLAARSRATSRAVFTPLGREDPIVVTSGARRAPETAVTLRADTPTEREALWAVLGDEQVLLLDVPPGQAWGVTHEYVSIGDVTEVRVADWGNHPGRWFTLPYLVVGSPAGGLQAQFTYADVVAEELTYQDVLDDYATYADLLGNRRRIGVLSGYGEGGYGEGLYGL